MSGLNITIVQLLTIHSWRWAKISLGYRQHTGRVYQPKADTTASMGKPQLVLNHRCGRQGRLVLCFYSESETVFFFLHLSILAFVPRDSTPFQGHLNISIMIPNQQMKAGWRGLMERLQACKKYCRFIVYIDSPRKGYILLDSVVVLKKESTERGHIIPKTIPTNAMGRGHSNWEIF